MITVLYGLCAFGVLLSAGLAFDEWKGWRDVPEAGAVRFRGTGLPGSEWKGHVRRHRATMRVGRHVGPSVARILATKILEDMRALRETRACAASWNRWLEGSME